MLTHANAMSVCKIAEELNFVSPDETIYLYLPLAHVFALLTQIASYDQGTTLVYFGGDTKNILQDIIQTKPTYLPLVPRIFEKLYVAATGMQQQAGPEDQKRFKQAIKLGVEVRRRRQHGEPVPDEMHAQFDQADEQIFVKVRQLFGGHRSPGGQRRRADRAGDPGVLRRRRCTRARGLGHDREHRAWARSARSTSSSSGPSDAPSPAWRSGSPTRMARS